MNMQGEAERLFNEAIQLRDLGEYDKAITNLIEVQNEGTVSDAATLGVLGHIYFLKEDWPEALKCFVKLVTLSPRSELASLNLFHTFIHLERVDEAFDEARRFLSVRDSEEYRLLFNEINERAEKENSETED